MPTLRTLAFAAGFMTLGALGTMGAQATAGPGGHGAHLARLIQKLDLTEDQKTQASEIRDAMRSHHKDMSTERDERSDEMLDLLGSADIDRDVVHAEIDAKISEQAAFAHDMADRFLDLHATLDDAQRATLVEQAEEAIEQRSERHGQRGERGEHSERGERGERGDL